MPIYAFECAACGHQFDRLQRLADADPTECPVCAQAQVRRQLTAPSFRLAGAGWYETDFKKDGDKKRNLVDKPEPAPASAGGAETPKAEPNQAAPKPEPKRDATSEPKPAAKPVTPSTSAP